MDPTVKGPTVTGASVFRKAAIVAGAGIVVTGCSFFGSSQQGTTTSGPSAASGASQTSAAATADVISPDKANSLILPKDDVSQLVGSELDYEGKSSNPGKPTIDGKESCRSLVAPLTLSLGESWTTYRNVWLQEAEKTYDHWVSQRVVLYPKADAAAEAFASQYPADIRSCTGEVLKSGESSWRETVKDVTPDRAQWADESLDNGQANGWRCSDEARVIDNLLLSVTVCQRGNSAPAMKAIIDRMVAGATKSK